MELTAFNHKLGISQGRLETPTSSEPVFVLGDGRGGQFHEVTAGDHVQVSQLADLTEYVLAKAVFDLEVPASNSSGFGWKVSLRIDGVEKASTVCEPGRIRKNAELAAVVTRLDGFHEISLRLELVDTGN